MGSRGGAAVDRRPRQVRPVRRTMVTALAVALMIASGALPAFAAKPVTQPNPTPVVAQPPALNERVEAVIAVARTYLDVPYRIGSEGPNLFDCSGLMYRIFEQTNQLDLIGGARLRAAGYMRWFMANGRAVANVEDAERGDLVIFGRGTHIGVYLGEGRVLSAITSGVTVHSLHGITTPPTAYLKVDWTRAGGPLPNSIANLPTGADVDADEAPASLVPTVAWVPTLDPELVANEAGRLNSERPDMRTSNTRTFDNGDGTYTTEVHARPIFYQAPEATDWQPIDLGFAATDTGAAVTTSPVALSLTDSNAPGGFLTAAAGERHVSLLLPNRGRAGAAGTKPVISADGRVADYFDLLQRGVGMRVFAQADGFKSFVVMRDEPAANRFSFNVDAPGMTLAAEPDGSISLSDETGAVVGRMARPLLLDSSDVDGNGGGVFTAATSLSLSLDGERPMITVSIERRYLDEAVYPAFVDVSLTDFPARTAGADMTFASSRHPNTSFDRFQRPEGAGYAELWHGRMPASRSDSEIFLRFPNLQPMLGGATVEEASLELFPYWQREQAEAATVVRLVTADWSPSAVTWNTRPVADVDADEAVSEAGAWSGIDLTTYVAEVLAGAPDYGLALAGDGSGAASWKRFVAAGAAEDVDLSPRLVVRWSGLRPAGVAVSDVSTRPVLRWTHAELAPDQRRFQVQLSRDGFTTVALESGTVKGRRGLVSEWAAPTARLTSGAGYAWRVRVKYGTDKAWSAWSAPMTFTFGMPKVESEPF